MHTVKKLNAEEWQVGFYQPKSDSAGTWYEWDAIEVFYDKEKAYALVSYLNGGSGNQLQLQ